VAKPKTFFDFIDFETRREEGQGEGEGGCEEEGETFNSIVPAEMGESTPLSALP